MNVINGIGLLAFGDSFTVGSNATNNVGYAQQLATYIGGTSVNYGVGSSMSTVSAKKALEVLPEGYRRPVISYMAGLNDIRGGGTAALPKLEGNLRSFLAACFLRDVCPASKMRRTGTWTAQANNYGGKSFYCGGTPLDTSGSLSNSLEWDFYGDNVVIGAYPTNGVSSFYRDLSISVDGGAPVTFELLGKTNELISYDAKIIRGLGAGIHTVRVTPLSTSAHNILDYVGTLVDGGTQSPVFVSEIPYLLNWAQYSSIATQAICDAANVVINNVVAEFPGLDIEVIKVNDFYDPTLPGKCSSDGIHPTSSGHADILNAFKDKITLIPS